jgi:hypothetical protein
MQQRVIVTYLSEYTIRHQLKVLPLDKKGARIR